MKREESALDFLENVANLRHTPLHHLPGHVPIVAQVDEEELERLAEEHRETEKELAAKSKILSLAEERQQLFDDPHNFVRSRIKQQVQDVVWLDLLREQLKGNALESECEDRCIICTLPYGKCIHTQDEPKKEEIYSRADKKKDQVDRELDDMLGVMGASVEVDTSADATEGIDLDTMRWIDLKPDLSDKIGATRYSLSTPPPRGWHTTVVVEALQLIVVFGGFRFKTTEVPQPFGVAPKEGEVEYLSDLYRFDTTTRGWFGSSAGAQRKEKHPAGRYGHVAANICKDKMLVFGGKGSHGRFLSDTWIYDATADSWSSIEPNSASPSPPSRSFAACVVAGDDIYLFGGTDGVENFGDLWVFHTKAVSGGSMRWERSIAVGIPPSPRYGHQMVLLHNPGVHESRICIMGGCAVSPQSEVFGSAATPAETKMMLDLGKTLEASYVREGELALLGGQYLQSVTGSPGKHGDNSNLRDIYKSSAGVTSMLHESESSTRQAEKNLVLAHNYMEASRNMKLQKAKHPNEALDTFFLDIGDMMWKPQIYPPISGDIPCARMHFCAVSIGGYVIICGGVRPTSLHHSVVETDHTRIYAFDLHGSVWEQAAPRESSEFLELPCSIADADVMRAKCRLQLERDRGKVLGARNGMTLEVAEAEAVLNVCQWRYNLLHAEMVNMTKPPAPRWGSTFIKNGSRAFMFAGWNKDRVVRDGNFQVLDVEQEHERRRREEDEFQHKLETDRQNEEARNASANMQSAYELQQMLKAEKGNEAKERRKMVVEDVLSCVPPLTKPAPVRFVKANQHSMWVEWDKILFNSVGNPLHSDEVKYNLYMINGYQHFAMEDRVLVMPKAAMEEIAREKREANAVDDDMSILTSDTIKERNRLKAVAEGGSVSSKTKGSKNSKAKKVKNNYADYRGAGFPGEIVGQSKVGFDVAFDDGTFETNVHRTRMNLIKGRLRGDDEVDDETDLPEGMTLRQFDVLKAAKKAKQALLKTMSMFNKEAYIIEDDMAIATKKRIKRKLLVRETFLEKLNGFKSRPNVIRPFSLMNTKPEVMSRQGTAEPGKHHHHHHGVGGAAESKVGDKVIGDAGSDSDSSRGSDSDRSKPSKEEEEMAKLQALFDNGYDRKQYLESLRTQEGKKVTVQVHPNWELVYSGEDNRAEVTNLVPREVLFHDPNLQIPVHFVLQICGADFPSYEHSELSTVVEFETKPDTYANSLLLDTGGPPGFGQNALKAPGSPPPRQQGSPGTPGSNKTDSTSPMGTPPPNMKKEKVTFKAMIRGKLVEFEIEGHTVSGLAQGDFYM